MAEQRKRNIRHFRDLEVYQRAFSAAMISNDVFLRMDHEYEEIIGMLISMEKKSEKFCY